MPISRIHSLLPAKEVFAHQGAGAVARCVSNGLTESRFSEAAEVFGQPLTAAPFNTAPYQALAPKLGWLLGKNRGMAYAYLEHINRFGAPDMVEVHNRCQVAALIKRKRPDLRVVLHLHNDPRGMKAGKSTTARAWLRENLDGIFCVSGYIRQCVLDGLPQDKALDSKVMVTLNGCDRMAASPPEKQKLICVVGRMVPEKGMLETARAAAEIMPQHPQWKIIFIGARGYGNAPPSAYENEVLSTLSALGPQAEMTGYLEQSATQRLQHQAAISIVLSQWQEPAGLTVIEALASGSALITTRRGGIPEYAEGRAVILGQGSSTELASALDRMIGDGKWRHQWQAKTWSDYPFSVAETTRKLDAARASVLGN